MSRSPRRRSLVPRFKRSGHSLVVAAPREGEDQERAHERTQALSPLANAYGGSLTGRVPKLSFPYQEGVFLKLEQIEGRWWCGFEPYTFVDIPRSAPPEQTSQGQPEPGGHDVLSLPYGRHNGDPAGDWRRERWAQKYNKHWAEIINAWANLLTATPDGKVRAFDLGEGVGIDAVFSVSRITGWSRPGHHHTYFDRSK